MGKIGDVLFFGMMAILGALIPVMFAKLVFFPSQRHLAPAPFVATSTYLHLCDMALGEIKWIGGVPLCFIDLGKYRTK